MAKPIKFNLMVDGQSIRTLDELKDNFNIHDVMEYYENGTLLRWLEVRKYHEYAEKLKAIAASVPLEEKAKALFCVFDFPSDDENAQQAIFALVNSKKREQALKELNVNNAAVAKIIENYLAGYEKLKADIKQHSDDEQFIQTALSELSNKYACLLKLNWIDVCLQFKNLLPASIEKTMENLNSGYDIDDAISITNVAYRFIKTTLKANATNLTAIRRIVEKIANNFFIEFEQDYKQFFYEIKDSRPLIVYGLLMNKKIRDLLCYNLDLKEFASPKNIDEFCIHYLKKINPKSKQKFIHISNNPVFIISTGNNEVRECPNIHGTHKYYSILTNFVILNSLEAKTRYGDDEVFYIEMPDNNPVSDNQSKRHAFRKASGLFGHIIDHKEV